MKRRRAVGLLVAGLLCLLCTGCQWLQNEFFSLDRAAPAKSEPSPRALGPQRPW